MYRLISCSKYTLNFKSKLQKTCRIRQNSMQYLCTCTCMSKKRDISRYYYTGGGSEMVWWDVMSSAIMCLHYLLLFFVAFFQVFI